VISRRQIAEDMFEMPKLEGPEFPLDLWKDEHEYTNGEIIMTEGISRRNSFPHNPCDGNRWDGLQ